MANPSKETIRAAFLLQEHHVGDDVVFYAMDGGAAVVVINDEDLLEVMMALVNYVEAKEETGPSENGPVVVRPQQDIEA